MAVTHVILLHISPVTLPHRKGVIPKDDTLFWVKKVSLPNLVHDFAVKVYRGYFPARYLFQQDAQFPGWAPLTDANEIQMRACYPDAGRSFLELFYKLLPACRVERRQILP
jgi:hypothetical protein